MSTAETAIHRRVAACRAGTDPTVIGRLGSGWAVMGDPQVLRGYCLLLPDPVVPHLQALAAVAQARYLADLARLGQAVFDVTGALRINYAVFGNVEPALHAHVLPRYADEPPTGAHILDLRLEEARRFDVALDHELLEQIRARLDSTFQRADQAPSERAGSERSCRGTGRRLFLHGFLVGERGRQVLRIRRPPRSCAAGRQLSTSAAVSGLASRAAPQSGRLGEFINTMSKLP
jgi:diadenosine tetraphosphate (Ap4A) HIT family hydrolase